MTVTSVEQQDVRPLLLRRCLLGACYRIGEVQEQSQDLPLAHGPRVSGQRSGSIRVQVEGRIGTLADL